MNEEKIEELKNALRQIIELVTERDQPLSQELKTAIAKAMQHVAERIQQLRQEGEGPLVGQKTPELQPGPYPSSNVNSFKYDPKNQRLFVKFHGKDTAGSGPLYSYQNVPPYIYDIFSRGAIGPRTSGQNKYHRWIKGVTPSLGGALNALLKNGNFQYSRLS